jgi:hypothetical protein
VSQASLVIQNQRFTRWHIVLEMLLHATWITISLWSYRTAQTLKKSPTSVSFELQQQQQQHQQQVPLQQPTTKDSATITTAGSGPNNSLSTTATHRRPASDSSSELSSSVGSTPTAQLIPQVHSMLLQQNGPWCYIRAPIELAMIIFVIALFFATVKVIAVVPVCISAWCIASTINYRETELCSSKQGTLYRSYCMAVKYRLIRWVY